MPAWNVQVPKPLNDAVDDVVREGRFKSKAEFIRTAVREKLDQMGYKNSMERKGVK